MKRDREELHYSLEIQPLSKKQRLNNNTSKLMDHQYQIEQQTNNGQIAPQISQISLTTAMHRTNKLNMNIDQQNNLKYPKTRNNNNSNNSNNTDQFKYESHPTQPNKQVISLISDDDENEMSESTESSVSTDSASSDLYEHDNKGYLVFVEGLLILNKYKLIRQLGKGTFSRVFECYQINKTEKRKSKRNKFAIKVIRNVYKYQLAAQTELEVLRKIKTNDPDNKSCCIHIVEDDQYRGHPIFVFPLLGKSVYSFMVSNGYKPFCYDNVIGLMWQICRGVAYIHSLDIIITDLKPENIVLVNDKIAKNSPNRDTYTTPKSTAIKLIDFGSAVIHENNAKHTHLIQTRHYRAPEVVFKVEWTFSADIWSIGCILVEFIYGKMLFNTHCSIDHLNQMVKCIDSPPSNLLELIDDETWTDFFDGRGALNMYKAKRSPVQCKELQKYFKNRYQNQQCAQLYDLCTKLLCWNPNDRITAKQALQHPVFRKYYHNL